MSPKELLDVLQHYIESHEGLEGWRVVVPISGEGGIGGKPVVEIQQVALGFDWDHGKLFLYPKEPLFRKKAKKSKK